MPIPIIESRTIGTGRPIVLLHAFPLSHAIWKDIQFPVGYRFVLPDFPGFGLSPLGPSGITMDEAAKGLQKNIEKSGINEPMVLGGISMGGYWAMEFVRQFPEMVKSLVLISTRPGIDKPEARQKRLEMADKVEKEGTEQLVEAMIPGLLGKSTRENNTELVRGVSRWIRETPPQAVASAQRAMANRRDQTGLLAQLKTETLVMAGMEDALIPFLEAETMAKTLPKARLKLFQGTGHLIPLEAPREFEKSLNDFLSG